MNSPPIFDRRIANEFSIFADFIDTVFVMFEKLSWSKQFHLEFGFYERDKLAKTNIFFGIWYDAWKFFEIPLCIAIDYRGKAQYEKHQKIKRFIENKNIPGVFCKDFSDHTVILFDSNFFNFDDDDSGRLAVVFEDLSNFLEMNQVSARHKPKIN